VHLNPLFGEAVLVVKDFLLVEIAFDQKAYLLALETHRSPYLNV